MSGDYRYLGNGPVATGSGPGWTMSSNLYARCVRCDTFVSLDPTEYGRCTCGTLSKDIDAGRLGSSLGDDAIEIYRERR